MSFFSVTAAKTQFQSVTGLPSRFRSKSNFNPFKGSNTEILLLFATSRFSLERCYTPSRCSRQLQETSKVTKLHSWAIMTCDKSLRLFWLRLRISRVQGSAHSLLIQLLAKLSFFKKGSFMSAGTSWVSWFPLTSSSVRFLNRSISSSWLTLRLAKRNVINDYGFLTSESESNGTLRFDELLPCESDTVRFVVFASRPLSVYELPIWWACFQLMS